MRKPTAILACALSASALALPACGGGGEPAAQDPASEQAPPERVGQLERRVKELEQEKDRLRRQIEERESGPTGDDASGGADSGSDAGGGSASGAGAGAGAGSGGGGGAAGGSSGRADAGAGPDPGTPEDDRSVYDICGPNPAPEC